MQTPDFVTILSDGKDQPKKVTVAFAMAINALKKGHSTTIILMVNAVELGKTNASDGLDIGSPFEPVSALLGNYLALGGHIAICASCMQHAGLQATDIAPHYRVINGGDVIDLLMAAQGSLQMG